MSEHEKKPHTTLFVVPTNEQARKLNEYLPKGCMAIAPGAALAGSRWQTMIILRSKTTWGPNVLAWKPEHEERWFDEILSLRLGIGGEVL
jgi:hypothetical protein